MMTNYRILHIEDVTTDAVLVKRELEKSSIHFDYLLIDTEDEYVSALSNFAPDVILCDHNLPSFNSFEALKILKAKKLNIPFLVISATMTEDVALTIVKNGADDFILKDRLKRLPHAVLNAIEKYRFEKERKRMIDEAFEKEALSKELLAHLSDKLLLATKVAGIAIWEYIFDENKLIADDLLLQQFGYNRNIYKDDYEPLLNQLHPEDKKKTLELVKHAFVKKENFNVEFRIIWRDKSVHFLKVVAVVQRDSSNRLKRLIGTCQDITVAKTSEQLVRESEAKYHSLFDSSIDGILLSTLKGEIFAANSAACDIFKMSQTEISEAGITGLADISDDKFEPFLNDLQNLGKAKDEIRHIRKDGTKFPGEVSSVVFTDAFGEERISIIIRDITQRKNDEQNLVIYFNELKQALNELKKIMDSSPDIICVIDELGKFVSVSAASEIILGYKPHELIGMNFIDFVYDGDVEATKKMDNDILNGVSVTVFENRYRHKNSTFVPLIWSAKWDSTDKLVYCTAKDGTEKKKLENALRVERQQFIELFQQAPSCIGILKGPDHVYEMANPLYLKLIGKLNIIGKRVKDVSPELEQQGLIEILDKVYQTGENFVANEMVAKIKKKGNAVLSDVFVNVVYQAFRNSQGDIEGILFFIQQITEQVLARKKVEESEKLFRQIVETAQEGIWIIDENNHTTFVNQKMCDILGYSMEEMMDSTNLSFKDAEEQKNSIEQIERRRNGIAETHQCRYVTKTGKQIWTSVSTNPLFDNNRKYTGALAMITDITQKKQAEDRLQEKQEQLLASQQIAKIGSWHRNYENIEKIYSSEIYCSTEALRIMGMPLDCESFSFDQFLSIVHPDDVGKVRDAPKLFLDGSTSYYKIDHRIIMPDGSHKWVSRDAKLLYDSQTLKPRKIVSTIQDITQQKERERERKKNNEERELLIKELTKSNSDLKQFSFITSHNFRAPLSNLIGLLSLIDINSLSENNKEVVEMFKISTQQLTTTINDLIQILIIKNNNDVKFAFNNLNDLLTNICILLSNEINDTGCIINTNLKVESVYFNKPYLESILLNLISNAIKYRSPDRQPKIDISTAQHPNGDVLMVIKDNGLGIDLTRYRDRIFGFYQRFHTHLNSVGLGLYIVKSQITALGGEIEVKSIVNEGTSFFITFKSKAIIEGS